MHVLATWPEVKALIARTYPQHSVLSNDALRVVWSGGSGPPGETLELNFGEIAGRGRLFLGAFVAMEDDVPSREALAFNSQMMIGSLVLYQGKVVCRHVMTVGSFDASELAEAIESVGRGAERARGSLVRR